MNAEGLQLKMQERECEQSETDCEISNCCCVKALTVSNTTSSLLSTVCLKNKNTSKEWGTYQYFTKS